MAVGVGCGLWDTLVKTVTAMAEVIIAKHRNGPTGTIRLAWLPRYTRFADMSRAG